MLLLVVALRREGCLDLSHAFLIHYQQHRHRHTATKTHKATSLRSCVFPRLLLPGSVSVGIMSEHVTITFTPPPSSKSSLEATNIGSVQVALVPAGGLHTSVEGIKRARSVLFRPSLAKKKATACACVGGKQSEQVGGGFGWLVEGSCLQRRRRVPLKGQPPHTRIHTQPYKHNHTNTQPLTCILVGGGI